MRSLERGCWKSTAVTKRQSLVGSLLYREKSHKVFKGLVTKGKNSMGWFFGFKLHLVINNFGEIMSACLTKANVDDRKPVPKLVESLKGWLFGDKGYLGQAFMKKP